MDRWSAIIEQLPALRRYALSLTGELDAADDLVQATAERAYRKSRLFQFGKPIRPWLFSILHNLYVDDWRKRQEEPQNEADATEAAPHHTALQHDLFTVLQTLPLDQRSVVLLVDFAGFRYREAAQILNVPEGTVMSRLSRARQQLQQQLSSYQSTNVRSIHP